MIISASNYERPAFWSDRLLQSKRLVLFFEVDAPPLHAACMVKKFLCRGNLTGTETRPELTFLMESKSVFSQMELK